MTAQEKQQLKAIIIATSMYYGHKLEDQVITLYVEDLEDLEFISVIQAIKDVRRDPKTTRFPLPALIRAKICPPESREDIAREVAARIIQAVGLYGWNNPDRAKCFIGELGWLVVARQGGWRSICQEMNEDNKSIMQAQMRDLAHTLQNRSAQGTLDQAPGLPSPEIKTIAMTALQELPK